MEELNEVEPTEEQMSAYCERFQAELESFRQVVSASAGLENVKVRGKAGKVLLSSDASQEGDDYSADGLFRRGFGKGLLV